MKKLQALGCVSAAAIAGALFAPLFIANAVPPAKPSPTPTVAPYAPAYERVEGPIVTLELTPGIVQFKAKCPVGKYAVGGGYTDSPGDGTVHIFESYPSSEVTEGVTTHTWNVSARKVSGPVTATLVAFAVCANIQ
jgi:hypothetical protein